MKDPIPTARQLVTQARELAHEARAEATRLRYVLGRRSESRALLKIASATEAFAERLGAQTDSAEHARPLLVEDEL